MMPQMLQMIKDQEGFSASPYTDTTGNLTIGYGTNLTAGIDKNMATMLLSYKIGQNFPKLNQLEWFKSLDPVRQSVIENMAYNMGVEGVMGFHMMIAAIEVGDWVGAASEMVNSIWYEQVGQRAVVLSEIMREGKFPDAVAA